MIYRIGCNQTGPHVDLDPEINFDIDLHKRSPEIGNLPFFLVSDIHSYADIWNTPHIQFIGEESIETDEYPDLTVHGGKLFLSEKAYSTLKEILEGHGEFLPVTFNAGKGYIFNPLEDIAPIEGSIKPGEYGSLVPSAYQFNEENLPPIFRTGIDGDRIFITKDLYRMIRLNGLNGLLFYKDYSNTYAEPEGGYKGSTSMPGYEDED